MEDEIEWRESSVGIYSGGRTYPFTTPLDLLRFRPLSIRARLRMGLVTLLIQRRYRAAEPFEHVSARDWVTRTMGREVWEKVWGPLLRDKFGRYADDIAMAWLWSKLTVRRQIKGKEARRELLGYPRHSWETLFSRLRDRIEVAGGRVMIDRPAVRISAAPDGAGLDVLPGAPESFRRGHDPGSFEADDDAERYDGVIATVPSDTCSIRRSPRRSKGTTSSAYAAAATRPRSACSSSSIASSGASTGPTSRISRCRSSA